jgi:hypothetical protein
MQVKSLLAIIKRLQATGQEWRTVDAKADLILDGSGDKAEFIKDVVAMANNGEPSYIVIGLQDKTFTAIGKLVHHYDKNTLNQILAGKVDPPITVGYREFELNGNEYAVVEVRGNNRPYIVAQDLIHGPTDRKRTRIHKGTIYIRHEDRTTGISRAELDKFSEAKQPFIEVSLELEAKRRVPKESLPILMYAQNKGQIMAHNIEMLLLFSDCHLARCPKEKHGHAADHYGNLFTDTSLTFSTPNLLANAVSEPFRFSLVPDSEGSGEISLSLKGGNITTREVSIKLSKIDEDFRTW